jgi:organic radical activating enzyme
MGNDRAEMNKPRVEYVEFYITNVCNLTCTGCNRFNDRKFTGWQRWSDYVDVYEQWAEQIDISMITILGGEPLLNSTFYDWLEGITRLWPKANVGIPSNGYQLPKHKKFYKYLKDNKRISFNVGVHNKKERQKLIGYVQDFLEGNIRYDYDNTLYREVLKMTDENDVTVEVRNQWWFHQGAIVRYNNIETLHNSDPEVAHEICHSKSCHHFDKGKLYKCGASALFKEYDDQFSLTLSDSDRQLISDVPALELSASYDEKQKFITQVLPNPIPQCKFCPEVYNGQQIFAVEKKNL